MSYTIKKILSIVLNAKKRNTKSFLFYDKNENMCCYIDWCYRAKERKVRLSDLTPEYKPKLFSEYYQSIKKDMTINGLNLDKGVITVKKNNNIIDGHHRYFLLKEIFGDDYEITVIELLDRYNVILHYIFLLFIIKPIKLIYRCARLILSNILRYL
jgi:hypothetical protein